MYIIDVGGEGVDKEHRTPTPYIRGVHLDLFFWTSLPIHLLPTLVHNIIPHCESSVVSYIFIVLNVPLSANEKNYLPTLYIGI